MDVVSGGCRFESYGRHQLVSGRNPATYAETRSASAEILVPVKHMVENWAAAVEAHIKRERPELPLGKFRRSYRLTWRNGSLDFSNCSVRSGVPCRS